MTAILLGLIAVILIFLGAELSRIARALEALTKPPAAEASR